MADASDDLLRARLEDILPQVELLQAMYPDELNAEDDGTLDLLGRLQQWCDDPSPTRPTMPDTVSFTLTLSVDGSRTISLVVEVAFAEDIRIRPRQPDWLPKSRMAHLETYDPSEDLLSTIEAIHQNAKDQLAVISRPAATETTRISDSMVRVWFYFPSISTRAKRDDIVNLAPSYGLTGFLLAGKPGILCLEGDSQSIDANMKYIKTESWGDIPSQHKKVSERYRQCESVVRAFDGMEEITDQLEKRGERSNRGDMRALEKWLAERRLGDALAKVLM